jgi:pyruvate dehydrogenase E1 component beta subunit
VSKGLHEQFGDRVRDAPISEAAFVGFATGSAIAGLRPVVEFQIAAMLYVAFDQVVNQAQKVRLMTGGQVKVPVTYLFPGSGARSGLAGQHSDHPYMLLAHAGVKTVVPTTPDDAYGLLRSAIRDDDPVAVFCPASCLPRKGDVRLEVVSLGQALVRRPGRDVTVVAVGGYVHEVLAWADVLAAEDIDIEVIDPRSILPVDWETICGSVSKTRRLVVVDDSNRTGGFAGEVISTVTERVGTTLRTNPRRVTRADVTVPFAIELERAVLPTKERVISTIREVAVG